MYNKNNRKELINNLHKISLYYSLQVSIFLSHGQVSIKKNVIRMVKKYLFIYKKFLNFREPLFWKINI